MGEEAILKDLESREEDMKMKENEGKTKAPRMDKGQRQLGVRASILAIVLSLCCLTLSFAGEANPSLNQLIEGFKKATVASIADAVDQVTGQRGFMYHDMRPLFKTKMVGPAVTALLRPSLKASGPTGPNHSLLAIDEADPGSVVVIVVEEGLDISGIGGLMATACKARDLSGAVIDGAARDMDEIIEMAFPVFSRSITSATSVGRYTSVGKNIPVQCAGVTVNPGDIIVGGSDGVVVVPRNKAAEILDIALQIDEKEAKMVPLIKQEKSILKAVEKYKRL